MYSRFADRQGWKFEVLGSDPSDMGGFNEVTFVLSGDGVWTRMKHEAGPHRVQRVPVTESQGRVHTSSATVTVMNERSCPSDLIVSWSAFINSRAAGPVVFITSSAQRLPFL